MKQSKLIPGVIVGLSVLMATAIVCYFGIDNERIKILSFIFAIIILVMSIVLFMINSSRNNETDTRYKVFEVFLRILSILLFILVFIDFMQSIQSIIDLVKLGKEVGGEVGASAGASDMSDFKILVTFANELIKHAVIIVLELTGAIICGYARVGTKNKNDVKREETSEK